MRKPCGFSSQDRDRAQRSKQNVRTEGSNGDKVAQGIVLTCGPAPEIELEASTIQSGIVDGLDIGTLRETLGQLSRGFRNRKLSVFVVVCAVLYFVIGRLPSWSALLDELAQGKVIGCRKLQVTSAAFCERLQQVPHTMMLAVLRQASASILERLTVRRAWVQQLAPFARGVYAIDDTTMDALSRKIKSLKAHVKGAPEVLAGRLACALDLSTGTFAQVLYDSDSKANEKSHVRAVLQELGMDALVVLDLGYFSFELFDWITGHFQYYVTRMREKTSFQVLQVLAEGRLYRDRVVFLGVHGARAAYPVRYIELFINGAWHGYVTNVLDPTQLTASQVWALYEQRWSIEMAFQVVKRVLGLASIRCCHENGVLMQVWATLVVYQALQALRLQTAAAAGWQEDRISWEMLMRRIRWYAEDNVQHLSLAQWLGDNAHELRLEKRGTRKRRDQSLPKELLNELRAVRPVQIDLLPVRRPRYETEARRAAASHIEFAAISPAPALT